MKSSILFGAAGLAVLAVSSAFAQNTASNKAFFAKSTTGITFAPVSGAGFSAPITLISVPAALKTSSGGAVSATVSMESILSTYNLTTAIVNGGKSSSSSRAAIKVWVEVDGKAMEPGEVVFNDRLQATGLTVQSDMQPFPAQRARLMATLRSNCSKLRNPPRPLRSSCTAC